MNTVIGILIGLLVLTLLVIAHEGGHFIAARRNGVKVNEFGIGFPPKAIAWVKNPEYEKWKKAKKKNKSTNLKKPQKWLRLKKSEWGKPQKTLIFSINWLPLGGFCAMDGESDSDTKKGTFGAASFWGKTKILFGGVAANWLVAFVILTILAIVGMPDFMDNQFTIPSDTTTTANPVYISKIADSSPAKKADIRVDDQISAAADSDKNPEFKNINSSSDLIDFNESHAGKTVVYKIKRPIKDSGEEETLEKTIKLNGEDAEYRLGVSMYQKDQTLRRSTWSAPIVGAVTTVQLTGETFRGLWNMLWDLCSGLARQFSFDDSTRQAGREAIGSAGDSVSGPVGIIGVLFPSFTQAGPINLAFLAAVISISLACMNVLPIPALDGGRWFMIALYRLRGKKLKKETEEKAVTRAFLVLIALIILITILDIIKLF